LSFPHLVCHTKNIFFSGSRLILDNKDTGSEREGFPFGRFQRS
jgi:hypothetical protein